MNYSTSKSLFVFSKEMQLLSVTKSQTECLRLDMTTPDFLPLPKQGQLQEIPENKAYVISKGRGV